MSLADLITRMWLQASDNVSEETIADLGPEATYRLGFANALQLVGTVQPDEKAELLSAIHEAVELEAAPQPGEQEERADG